MSDRMTPMPFGKLMEWILAEHERGSIFGIRKLFTADPERDIYNLWKEAGDALWACGWASHPAGPEYRGGLCGRRPVFRAEDVQKIDGEDLPVAKPCIKADDECYNCEWSTELYVPQAFDEYVKAWFACHFLAKEYGLGAADGFQFNMSVGYDLEGIKLEKIDRFIEGMKDASQMPIFKECRQWLADHAERFSILRGRTRRLCPRGLRTAPHSLRFTDVRPRRLSALPGIFWR